MKTSCLLLLMVLCHACGNPDHASNRNKPSPFVFKTVGEIPVPAGFERTSNAQYSFGDWLRKIDLKKDNHVYLYDGRLKSNQSAQFAVLNIPVGKKDLQQCADAIMRLRAEYWLSRNKPDSISFTATNGQELPYSKWRMGTRYKLSGNKLIAYHKAVPIGEEDKEFNQYLEFVFSYCGTISLFRQLKPISKIQSLQAGDVWIYPGSPGHAMLVVDVCTNKRGQKMFMLAQSYMPAQDIHIVVNPASGSDPWYLLSNKELETPEWTFEAESVRRWE